MIILYGIKNCDSVKKARHWLQTNGVRFQFHDFRIDGLDETTINHWLKSTSWEVLLNKRSTTWKQLNDYHKEHIDERMAIKLMLENPTLIKRPVLIHSGHVVVGFKEFEYVKYFH